VADLVRFVDSVAASPAVRLNLSAVPWNTHYTTRITTPRLQRAEASTLLNDGAFTPASKYGDRTVFLELQLSTTSADAAATQLQTLMRELDRETNVLQWQPDGASNPVFLRTKRADTAEIENIRPQGGLISLSVEVPAEPFAFGVKETLSNATVNNDPANGSNGCFFDVSGIKGDVETPLFLSCDSGVQASGRRESAIGVRHRGTVANVPFVLQCESMTVGTNTTVQTNDTLMSGAGSNYTRTTFGDTNHITRLTTGPYPASASVDARGTYRVFARYRKSVSGDSITIGLSADSDGTITSNDEVTLPSGTSIRYVDLGLLQIPMGYDPVTDGYSGTELSARGQTLYIQAGRPSGSGNLDLDVLLFVPADDRFCVVKWSGFSGPTSWTLDSARASVYGVGASGEVYPNQLAPVLGLPPLVSPGVTNRVFFVRDTGSGASGGDVKTGTVVVTPYYWPRYLYVKPAST